MKKPKKLSALDFQPLKSLCQEYLDFVASKEFCEDNDFDQYIFEQAMKCVFGDNVFEYINSKM